MDLDKCCGEGRGPEAALHLPVVPTLLLAAAVLVTVSVWHYYFPWPAGYNANSIRQEPKVPYPTIRSPLTHARKELPFLLGFIITYLFFIYRSLCICLFFIYLSAYFLFIY